MHQAALTSASLICMLLSIHPCNGLRLNNHNAAAHVIDVRQQRKEKLIFAAAARHNPGDSVAFQPFDTSKNDHSFLLNRQRTHGDLNRCDLTRAATAELYQKSAYARQLFVEHPRAIAETLVLQHNIDSSEICVQHQQAPSIPYIPKAPSLILHVHDSGSKATAIFPSCADPETNYLLASKKEIFQPKIMTDYNVQYDTHWPPAGTCTAQSKCSLTVYLAGGMEMHDLDLVVNGRNFNLAHYARFPECAKQLRTVLTMPVLPTDTATVTASSMIEESKALSEEYISEHGIKPGELESLHDWDKLDSLDNHLIPFANFFLSKHADVIDSSKVVVTGQSAGGGGAFLAAVRYPDIFTIAMGAPVCSYNWRFDANSTWAHTFSARRPDGLLPTEAKQKLQMVTLGMGNDNLFPDCMLSIAAITRQVEELHNIPISIRFYPNLGHAIWPNMYASAFEWFWQGHSIPDDGSMNVLWMLYTIAFVLAFGIFCWYDGADDAIDPSNLISSLTASTQVRDSLNQVVRSTKLANMLQNSLYGAAVIQVCLAHWLPHQLSDASMPSWALAIIDCIAHNHNNMGMVLLLCGFSNSRSNGLSLGKREIIVLVTYLALSWPLWFNLEVGVYHRWVLLWLLIYKVCLVGFSLLRIPAPLQIALCLCLAYPLGNTPDAIHEFWLGSGLQKFWSDHFGALVIEDPTLLIVNEFFFWSLGHKVYWGALYLLGHHYGHGFIQVVEKNENILRSLISTSVKCLAALGLFGLWYMSRYFSRSFEPDQELGLGDFPDFFISPLYYLVNTAFDLAGIGALIFAVGINNKVLRLCGKGIFVTFLIHVYFRPMLFELMSQNGGFASIGRTLPVLGGVIQLAIIVGVPTAFAMVQGFWQVSLTAASSHLSGNGATK